MTTVRYSRKLRLQNFSDLVTRIIVRLFRSLFVCFCFLFSIVVVVLFFPTIILRSSAVPMQLFKSQITFVNSMHDDCLLHLGKKGESLVQVLHLKQPNSDKTENARV